MFNSNIITPDGNGLIHKQRLIHCKQYHSESAILRHMDAQQLTQYARGIWASGLDTILLISDCDICHVPFHTHQALHLLRTFHSQTVLGMANIQERLSNFNCGIKDISAFKQIMTQLSSQRDFCQEILLVSYKSSESSTRVSHKPF